MSLGGPALSPASLIDLLRLHREERPSKLAFTFLDDAGRESARWTYAELDRRVRQVAAALRDVDLKPGERALLLFPPGVKFIAAFLGCLYAEVVAVPAYPPASKRHLPRLRSIVGDACPTIVLTTANAKSRLHRLSEQLDEQRSLAWLATDELEDGLVLDVEPIPTDDTLAFLQYTSGSTSTPKGVKISHGNVMHNEAVIRAGFGLDETAVIVGWLPLYHDMGLIGTVLQTLYLCASAVLMSPVRFLRQPLAWLEASDRYRGTVSGGPNFAYDLCAEKLAKLPASEDLQLDLSCWQIAFNGAEPVRAETLERFAAAMAPYGFARCAFFPCYGLAEATLMVSGSDPLSEPTVRHVRAADLEEHRAVMVDAPALEAERSETPTAATRALVSSGRVAEDQQLLVVDPATRKPCALGAVGEIWIAGASVAQGYWANDEATAQDFGARPQGWDDPATSFLRTGDLGFLHNGELFVTGRLCRAASFPERSAEPNPPMVFVLSPPRSGSTLLRVMLAGHSGLFAPPELDLLSFNTLAERREAFSGRYSFWLEGLLRALMEVTGGNAEDSRSFMAEREDRGEALAPTMLEPYAEKSSRMTDGIHPLAKMLGDVKFHQHREIDPKIADRWQEIYQEDFFGGMIWRLAKSLGYERPASWQTAQAEEGKAVALRSDSPQLESLPRQAGENRFPISFAQQRLWVVDRLAPGSAAYNVPLAVRLHGALDERALRTALTRLVMRDESLRTHFTLGQGEAEQVILPPAAASALLCDLTALDDADRSTLARRWARQEAARPFDLARGPLFRILQLRLDREDSILLLNTHHAISDGWSMGLLLRELIASYRALANGLDHALPDLPLQFADYAVWQRRRLSGPIFAELLAAWQERLAGSPTLLDLPNDRPRPKVQNFRGDRLPLRLDEATSRGLRQLGQSHGVTPFMTFLTAFGTLLMRWSNQTDLVIDSPVANRNRQEFEGVIGFFVNTLALRLNLAHNPLLVDALRQTREVALAAYRHEEMPFEKLVEALQPERNLAHHPLFQVALVLQNVPLERMNSSGELRVEPVELAPAGAKFDWTLSLSARGEQFGGAVEFSTDLFDTSTLERWIGHLQALLRGMVENPQQRLWALPLLTPEERQTVLEAGHGNGRDFALSGSLHERFAAQAIGSAEAVALVLADRALSYGVLHTRSQNLAQQLLARGLGAEESVGLLAERGFDLLIGLLGILQAGGAYLPLDPTFPPERRAFMLQDAAVRFLLGDSLTDRAVDLPPEIESLDLKELASASAAPTPLIDPSGSFASDRLAYVIYTSGTTGRPKGTSISHRNVLRLLADGGERFGFSARDTWTFFHSVAFDFSVWEIWGALHQGGRLVVVPYTVSREPRALACLLAQERVLVNMYGITETTVHITSRPLAASDLGGLRSIGRPLDDLELHVLDPLAQLAPIGVLGELNVGGAGLGRGYLARPSLTAERFVPHAFSPAAGWSLGGLTAFETARQLQAAGEEIQLLAIVDVWAGVRQLETISDIALLLETLGTDLGLDAEDLARYESAQDGSETLWQTVLERAHQLKALPSEVGLTEVQRHIGLLRAGREAAARYSPAAFSGSICLFRARDRPANEKSNDSLMGWSEVARGGVHLEELPGNHGALLRVPGVETLAEILRRELARQPVQSY